MLYIIFEFIGIVFFWIFLNLKTLFEGKNKRRYYSFAELLKGRSIEYGGEQDGRPYTQVGFVVMLIIALIALFMSGVIV